MLWLLVDATYLCHRSWHSTGHLEHEGQAIGVSLGFLKTLDAQVNYHGADRIVFAFDHGGTGLRGQIRPSYKADRVREKERQSEEEKESRYLFYRQIDKLRLKYLPAMGYRNIFCCKGYEGDDILAVLARGLPETDEGVIITADNDLWQCLRSNVRWYSPGTRKLVTFRSFKERWKIDPVQWSNVKALAGCTGDNVKGIRGIGEITAARWFEGTLKDTSKAYQNINDQLDVHNDNLPLVRLPFPGLELPKLRDDELTEERRIKVEIELGMRPSRRPTTGVSGFDI